VDLPWADRLDLLREHALDAVPLLLVLDNFEDNLTGPGPGTGLREVRDPALAGLLAAWVATPGRSRVLLTCRYPFDLPEGAAAWLEWRQVGPLSLAETRKLVWSLPRLDHLDDADADRLWRMVGGHPRTLEYVDALLARGEGRFPDITARLTEKVHDTLGERADQWLRSDRDLDAAPADAVTVAADDVLLDRLLADISATPGTESALLGMSVYREPVDRNALLFHIGDTDQRAATAADRDAAAQRILVALAAHDTPPKALGQAMQAGDLSGLPASLAAAIAADLAELAAPPTPPRSTTVDLPRLIDTLARSSLLTTTAPGADAGALFMHRWTASELTRRWTAAGRHAEVQAAHLRAADYWQWRAKVWPQDRQAAVHDLLEARHHLLAAGRLDAASTLTEGICLQLGQWGAWDQEAALIDDTLSRLPSDHPRQAAWIHTLGILAQHRGDYAEAERRYRQALDINERLGNQAGMASGYHQLGRLAQHRGDYAEAERRYQQALDIKEQLGNQADMATSYHQLGILAQDRGDYAEAERRYQQALGIEEQLGNQADMATSLSQLGALRTAQGQPAEAIRWHARALSIRQALQVPQAAINLRALTELRNRVGEAAFLDAVRADLNEDSASNLLALLERAGRSG
jgi:tetratricopeptide (TPR) repeat protein